MSVNRCSFVISYAVGTSGAATRRSVSPASPVGILTNVGIAIDTGLTRSDKIALGVGLGVGIPSAIAGIIVIIQFCTGR